MDENPAIDTRGFRKFLVSQTPPYFGQCLATLETFRSQWNGLDAPVPSGLVGIDHVNCLTWLDVRDAFISFQFKEMLLQRKHQKGTESPAEYKKGTFQGKNCSKRMIFPVGSTAFLLAETDAMRRSLAGNHALA